MPSDRDDSDRDDSESGERHGDDRAPGRANREPLARCAAPATRRDHWHDDDHRHDAGAHWHASGMIIIGSVSRSRSTPDDAMITPLHAGRASDSESPGPAGGGRMAQS